MKGKFFKTNTLLICFLFLLYSFVPLCTLFAKLFGYKLILNNSAVCAGVTLAIGAVITIAMFIFTGKKVYKFGSVLAGISLLLTEVNWIIYGFIDSVSMIIIAFTFVFAFMIWIRFARPMIFKVIIVIIAVIMLPILTFFSVIAITYENDVTTIVETVESPDAHMYAVVSNIDKADGGKYTNVDVYEKNSEINLGFLGFEKESKPVYHSDGEAFENISLIWSDKRTLKINDKEYIID